MKILIVILVRLAKDMSDMFKHGINKVVLLVLIKKID